MKRILSLQKLTVSKVSTGLEAGGHGGGGGGGGSDISLLLCDSFASITLCL
jgi:Lanthionine-containing peptide SapB precursor RamS